MDSRARVATVLAATFFLAAVAVLAVVVLDRQKQATPPVAHSTARRTTAVTTHAATSTTTTTVPSTSSTTTTTTHTTTTPVPVAVPNVVGLQRFAAQAAIRGAGLVSEVKGVPSIEREGTVLGESPSAGATAQRGDHVYMTVASGARPKSG